ncbi:MAG TPA: efflux transporter outer membrane subunit [Pseudomonas xinjiangensis]|uniref:Efflux transporter outer membrane subunit n=2 Tax=root TaxID=1 RepID=A0A7V1BMC2_9GAMM|nr:efflux transporter outer membrane subunit [Halopseudomonas xinjiangensis]HEC49100.1 efflux transporter outer membrane subunit [Halopseudomonas xinjiangensis]
MLIKRGVLLTLMTLGLTGCAITTPVPNTDVTVPVQWSQPPADNQWPSAQWWEQYQSQELATLLQRGRLGNLDLATSASRLLQADALSRQAGAALLPQIGAGLSGNRGDTLRSDGNGDLSRNSYSATLNASYEVDFWGRNRASVKSAQANLQASRFDLETLAITVDATVATTWFQLLENQQRLRLASDSLRIAERVLDLIQARYRFGAADGLELSQQRTLVAQLRASLPALEQAGLQLRNSLALLLGSTPDTALPIATALATIQPPKIGAGLPIELLTRRPDIRASEARLVAANADLTAARAALLPSIQLTGQYGVQSLALSGLLNNPMTAWNLAAGLTQPIFQGGRLRAQVELNEARQEELLIDYRRTLLSALGDVDTALGAVRQADVQYGFLALANREAELAFNLAESRYRAGAITLQTLLDTQRTWYQSQDSLAQQRTNWLLATVDLYRALGGGWAEGALSYLP